MLRLFITRLVVGLGMGLVIGMCFGTLIGLAMGLTIWIFAQLLSTYGLRGFFLELQVLFICLAWVFEKSCKAAVDSLFEFLLSDEFELLWGNYRKRGERTFGDQTISNITENFAKRVQNLPSLPSHSLVVGSEVYFLLLQEWLQDCNERHPEHVSAFDGNKNLPTRLIEVGASEDDVVYLRLSSNEKGRYIALSHCWGNVDTFSTRRENIEDRLNQGMNFDELPKMFQDAVVITRKLGIQFLWIDSLCIIQGDEEDWKHECQRMEEVFSSAYCTIAATSAKDRNEGLLMPRPLRTPVTLREKDSGPGLYAYAGEVGENFVRDVEQEALNSRGWVFQERALSCRTIHFTKAQTYWECGSVIRCESLVQTTEHLNWLSDSRFPLAASRLAAGFTEAMFEHVYTQYSKLSLTNQGDRPAAISGLETRLAEFYSTKSTHGILHRYFHKGLLWQRSGNHRMKRIADSGFGTIPSWSWMACQGAICYGDISMEGTKPNMNVRLNETSNRFEQVPHQWILEAPLWQVSHDCCLERHQNTSCRIRGANEQLLGWMKYDIKDEKSFENSGFIVIMTWDGSEKRIDEVWERFTGCPLSNSKLQGHLSYVLAVQQQGDATAYKRIGVGLIQSDQLVPSQPRVKIH